MARIKIELPAAISFTTNIPVRITDVNYGGHVGNDAILSIIHEGRMQYLANYNYTELDFGGIGLIMSDVGIEFKGELFYKDIIIASITAGNFSKVGFDIYYKLEKEINGQLQLIAIAKTGMVGYDYSKKKIAPIPEETVHRLQSTVGS